VNGQHLLAFFWLHWRIRVNQMKRGGTANAVLLSIVVVAAVLAAAVLLVVFFLVGLFVVPGGSPALPLYLWDGLVAAFLFLWVVGLLTELQRSEALSLEKFLHLPVSLTGVFVLNYLSSLLSLSLIVFVPAMTGLALGLIFAKGPALLWQLPLVAAFFLMITAVTYQFRGWLASLMVNKRRRRTIIALVSLAFILVTQLPNMVNLILTREGPKAVPSPEQSQEALDHLERTVRLINLILPPGWLPLGAMAAAEGDVLPALLGTLGMAGIGTASLWRAYRTTVRLYTGHLTSGRKSPAPAVLPAKTGKRPGGGLLDKDLPWLSEPAAAIALGGFRSLTRAPEAKMMLLTPVLMVVIFGGMVLRGPIDMTAAARPLVAFGAMSMILFTMLQLVGNQFGFDRNGFRVFVLCPAPRKDILLGKNLAVAPLALGMGAAAAGLVQGIYPLRLDHFLALWPQLLSMYLVFCLIANWLSILSPMRTASGTLKPANTNLVSVLFHLIFSLMLMLVLSMTLLPLGVEFVLDLQGLGRGIPVCLLLSLVECVAVVYLYRFVLIRQGNWLQAREQRILNIVMTKAE
jgi:ABC-2 type transport system permease protein